MSVFNRYSKGFADLNRRENLDELQESRFTPETKAMLRDENFWEWGDNGVVSHRLNPSKQRVDFSRSAEENKGAYLSVAQLNHLIRQPQSELQRAYSHTLSPAHMQTVVAYEKIYKRILLQKMPEIAEAQIQKPARQQEQSFESTPQLADKKQVNPAKLSKEPLVLHQSADAKLPKTQPRHQVSPLPESATVQKDSSKPLAPKPKRELQPQPVAPAKEINPQIAILAAKEETAISSEKPEVILPAVKAANQRLQETETSLPNVLDEQQPQSVASPAPLVIKPKFSVEKLVSQALQKPTRIFWRELMKPSSTF